MSETPKFIPNLKKLAAKKPRLTAGHRMCPGCGISIILKQVLAATDEPVIVVNATGCAEICTSAYPQTSWDTPWIHSLFENTAAVASGVEAAQKSLARKNKLPNKKKAKILAIGGDGATYDIGLQALSGAAERGHDFVYLCFDNEGYMNTGYQRSSATPLGAATTTSPAGSAIPGKQTPRKDIVKIMAAHNIPYVAQGSPHDWMDLTRKAHKAFAIEGPAFLNVLSPCPTNWKAAADSGLNLLKNAVETCFWPLFEVENGKYKVNHKPKEKQPIETWLAGQKRFRHILQPENAELLKQIQTEVDTRWEELLALEGLNAK
jgi:pyruvate ferredoxin oxidoreductase beta subunit